MKRRLKPILFLPFALVAMLLLTVTSALAAPTQGSTSKHLPHFFPHPGSRIISKTKNASSNLIYHGGGVVQGGTSNTYAIFWQPNNNVSPSYHSLIERYFQDVGSSGLYNNNSQYSDFTGAAPSGSNFAGSWTDNSAYPNSPLLDSDIQAEVSRAQQSNGWPSGVNNIYFVFTEANADLCFDSSQSACASNAFCAYHGHFGNDTIYAAQPYAASFSCNGGNGPNGDNDADQTINVTSHEQMEAATDPLLNAWFDSGGAEIGDKCAWNFGGSSNGGNVNWNGNEYRVQQEWDNRVGGCVLDGP